MFTIGHIYAFIGAALAILGGVIGSSIALARTGSSVAGVCSVNPNLYGKVVVIQLLPATQGIYGFVIAIMLMSGIGVLGGGLVDVTPERGLALIIAALPVCVSGFFSAIYQGKVGCSAINMVGRDPSTSGKGIIMAAVVEFYAILGLLISILLIQ